MSYKEDLKKLRDWLGMRETGHVKAASNTHDKRVRNERLRAVARGVRRWRKKHRAEYNRYQREYMRAYRERLQNRAAAATAASAAAACGKGA